jgi:Zn-dependent protease
MIWTDGNGREWEIDANPEVIAVASGDETLRLERADWPQDLYVGVLDRDVVIRFQGQDREIGFLVSQAQATELFKRMGVQLSGPVADAEPPPPPTPPGDPMWPRVTAMSVWALVCGALAFIPAIGFLFGATSVLLAAVHRRRVRNSVAMAHDRVMGNVAIILAVAGMAVSALAVFTLWHTGLDAMRSVPDRIFVDEWIYSHGAIAATIIVIVISLSFHECGHAITAWWCGDAYAKMLGRVTLNPIAHIDLFGTIILPIVLATAGAPVFGYAKPVPVRLEGVPRYHRAQILVAAAGPGANLLLAAISLMLLLFMGCLLALLAPAADVTEFAAASPNVAIDGMAGAPVYAAVALVLKTSFMINLLLAFFNLIPVPPLDGSWILQCMFPRTLGGVYATIRPYGFLIFIAMLWTGILDYLMVPMLIPLLGGLTVVATCTGL